METPREIARDLVMRRLGADRCALWCGVPRNTVYVWLKRGTDAEPIPIARALVIFERARAEGMHFDIRLIAPAVPAGRV